MADAAAGFTRAFCVFWDDLGTCLANLAKRRQHRPLFLMRCRLIQKSNMAILISGLLPCMPSLIRKQQSPICNPFTVIRSPHVRRTTGWRSYMLSSVVMRDATSRRLRNAVIFIARCPATKRGRRGNGPCFAFFSRIKS